MNKTVLSRRRITLLIVCLIVISIPIFYFAVLRPSDSQYAAASSYVKDLKKDSQVIAEQLKRVQFVPGFIDADTSATFSNASADYSNIASSLSSLPVMKRDLVLQSEAPTYIATITTYGKSVANITKSIKLFQDTISECATMTDTIATTTISNFDDISKKCNASIDLAREAPDQSFKSGFLDAYLDNLTELVDSYKNLVNTDMGNKSARNAALGAVSTAKQKIANSTNVTITYSLPSVPTDALDKLSGLIHSQQQAFLR